MYVLAGVVVIPAFISFPVLYVVIPILLVLNLNASFNSLNFSFKFSNHTSKRTNLILISSLPFLTAFENSILSLSSVSFPLTFVTALAAVVIASFRAFVMVDVQDGSVANKIFKLICTRNTHNTIRTTYSILS